jgi:alpha-L-fucosidase 2
LTQNITNHKIINFFHTERERVSVNEDSLWTGGDNPSGDYNSMGAYQVLGNLFVNLPDHKTYTHYKRDLDIGDAVSHVEYESNGVKYKREFFASHASNVLVAHFSADKNKSYSGNLELEDSHKGPAIVADNVITVEGKLNNGLKYEWQSIVQSSGGSLHANGSSIEFKGCDSITVIIGAATNYIMDSKKNFRSVSSDLKVKSQTKTASSETYNKLREDHIKDFHSLFNRVDIELGNSSAAQKSEPTGVRKVKAVSTFDPDLEELLFQLGRYLLISSSRPGGLPANLQALNFFRLFYIHFFCKKRLIKKIFLNNIWRKIHNKLSLV